MKILHIVPSYYPAFKYGGPTFSVYLLNKALQKKGLNITVITTSVGIEDLSQIKENQWEYLNNIKIKYCSFFKSFFPNSYTLSTTLFSTLKEEIKNYDLVHITGVWNFPVLAGALCSQFNKKPYLISPRGLLYKEAIELKSATVKKIYYNFIVSKYIKKASAIHYTSQDERDKVTSYLRLNNKSFVVPNGIDLKEFEKSSADNSFIEKHSRLFNKKYILFLGRINKKKGLEILVETYKQLREQYNDLFLVIAGPDDDNSKKEVKSKLDLYGLSDNVVFAETLLGKEKISAYRNATVFALPSYSENFGMSVVEAMACGTPVIVSDRVGISREIRENDAGIVKKLNSSDFASGIRDILEISNYAQDLKQNGINMVRQYYDIDKVADRMIESYKNIIGSNYSQVL